MSLISGLALLWRSLANSPSASVPAAPCVADDWPPRSRDVGWRRLVGTGVAVGLLFGCDGAFAEPSPASPSNRGEAVDRFAAFVADAAQRFAIPAGWIGAVMRVESAGDPHALSPKGAMGLMQLMPRTWADLRLRYGLGADPYDPRDNIIAGAAYLRELHDRYAGFGFLAAYNAGPTRYEEHLATGRPLPAETRAFVADLAPLIGGHPSDGPKVVASTARSWTRAPLFAVHDEPRARRSQTSSDRNAAPQSPEPTAMNWTGLTPRSDGLFIKTAKQSPPP